MKDRYYLAAKKNFDSSYNDVVFVYDLIRNEWYPPIIGWNVNNWAILEDKLCWGDSTTPNVFRVIDDRVDNGSAYTSTFRTWQEDLGDPLHTKTVDMAYLEYYANASTDMIFTLIYDEDGYTQKTTFTILGTEKAFIFNSSILNVFGASDYATEIFGTNISVAGLKKRRVYLDFKSNVELYNISLEGGSESEGQNFEFLRWGIHVIETGISTSRKYLKSI